MDAFVAGAVRTTVIVTEAGTVPPPVNVSMLKGLSKAYAVPAAKA